MKFYSLYIVIFLSLMLQSCFTGIESTAPITSKDVKKQNIATIAEQAYLADIRPQNPELWSPGKLFYVTDPKVVLLYNTQERADSTLLGKCIAFVSLATSLNYTGDETVVFDFVRTDSAQSIKIPVKRQFESIKADSMFVLPFLIDTDLVKDVRDRLAGKSYYIRTPIWYTTAGDNLVSGLRHVEINIVDVVPGNSLYPLRVLFTCPLLDNDSVYAVYMTIGEGRTSTRNFETLFAFNDPRKAHPDITDDVWQLIMHSKVKPGMTKEECRLALGNPNVHGERPTTAGMVEYWQYTDGIYLLFEDGVLTSYR